MSIKLPFEQSIEQAELALSDLKNDLATGDLDSFFTSAWAAAAAIERSMHSVLTIYLANIYDRVPPTNGPPAGA